ncbi:uncharacterized protein KGF55_005039 [Candida pseudojiufengensis]|uniref:uncharacterized protein n=1 Tax=Candida pseudojiufengensis TaxID=497109 RepID=UPI002223EF71|nr:uncharacterized protein KGF55_005039 [Candida pseudojiufengensis]KAI5959807.1 hypothetical protein KGF55_005039 [Candida pseudojiufengensis]
MKFNQLLSWSLLSTLVVSQSSSSTPSDEEVTVYHVSNQSLNNNKEYFPSISIKDSQIYFDNLVGKDLSHVELSSSLIDLINEQIDDFISQGKSNLFINLKGNVKLNERYSNPIFKTSKSISKYFKNFEFGKSQKLSNEIISYGEESSEDLQSHFEYFKEKTSNIWQNFKSNSQKIIKSYNPTNDQLYINEISSLNHLNEFYDNLSSDSKSNTFILNFYSLLSIANKIGTDSETYKHQLKSFENLIIKMSKNFNIYIISYPYVQQDISHLQKRSSIESTFKTNQLKYGTKQACEVGTNNCNSHGECTQLKNKEEWSCLCSSSFNKTTSKTTNWVGSDCNKKDVSVPANLFLWTTIALVLLIAGGINLLASVGTDPLPGVLDAATLSPSKKNI